MVNTVIIILYALVVLIAVLLTCLILIQPSKSGGLGASFGGVGESVFGAHASSHLTKLTVIMITVFFVVVLALAVISGHARKEPQSILELESATAAPAKTAKTASPGLMEVTPSGEKIPVPVPKKEEVPAPAVPVQKSEPVSVPVPVKK
ncbi:MAG: preprotein translocase subunit SecG [Lentisphaerae bacterium GWF2_45_14]|nr:MAG: preprotein translocase subunit SecG [Lentisphaerae bacterium GWF2_45_14]